MKLTTKGISKRYRKKEVLHDISLSFEQGFYGLLGPNGSGKSTYLNSLCGIVKPDSGEVYYDEEDVKDMPKSYRKILRVLFQQPPVFMNHSVKEMMEYGAMLYEVPAGEQKKQISEALCRVHLNGEENTRVRALSGGMRQRLCIAMALLGNSEVILLDEPTVGLDITERDSLKQILKDLKKDRIVIMTTHILTDLSGIADEVIVLRDGAISNHVNLRDTPENQRTEELIYEVYSSSRTGE